MTPAADVLVEGLASIGGQLGAIVAAWPRIVGPQLAAVSTPAGLRDGTLRVRCASASWAQSLNGNELQLLERIARHVGPEAVRRVHARAGGPAPQAEIEATAPPPPLSPAEEQRLRELVEDVPEGQLRERILAAAIASARRRAMRTER